MLYVDGPGFQGLCAGDSVEFTATRHGSRGIETYKNIAPVARLLVFDSHVVVMPRGSFHGHVVNASNFVRLVRRGRRHIQADARAAITIPAALDCEKCARCGQHGAGPCGCGFQAEGARNGQV